MLHARPHLSVHTRAKNHSAVNGAAYRLGLKLFDHRAQVWRDYTHRKPGESIVHADTIAPAGAPAWATDPGLLWNRVEATERRKDAQVARDYRVPIPRGVSDEQAGDMARILAQFIVQELHTPVSFAVHRDADKDAFGVIKPDAEQGFHAHLYFPTRSLRALGDGGEGEGEGGGFGGKLKQFVNQASGSAMTERLNERWARVANLIAGRAGQAQTYDHRSYRRMGLARAPEPKLGQAATAMERRGIRTRKGDALRAHRAARANAVATREALLPLQAPFDPFAHPEQVLPAGDILAMPLEGSASCAVAPDPVVGDVASAGPSVAASGWMATPDPIPRPAAPRTAGVVDGERRTGVSLDSITRPRSFTAPVPHLATLDWSPTSVGHQPLPVVGLARRFAEAAKTKASALGKGVPEKIVALVQAIEAALNALMRVGLAVWRLDQHRKRYATARFDNHFTLESLRAQRDTLRRESQMPKRAVRVSAAHRKRLAEIQTLDEEIRAKVRLGERLDAHVQAMGERMDPWHAQVKADRRHLKAQLAELAEEGLDHVDTLLEVASPTEKPWIAMYQKRHEPQRSMQTAVDRQEQGAKAKPGLRPKLR